MRTLAIAVTLLLGGCPSSVDTSETGDTDADTDTDTDTEPDPCAPPVDPGEPVDPLADTPIVELVQAGFQFVEGPVWDCAEQRLLFSDIPANTIYAVALDGTVSPFRTASGQSNGLAFDPDGHLLAAEHGNRRVSRTLDSGAIDTVADRWEGALLNSPNDLVVRADGTIWFTDPPYGLNGRPAELDFNGLFRVDPAGALHLDYQGGLTERPNGVTLSPDASVLYLADTSRGDVVAYDVASDGALSNRRAFASAPGADGLAMDVQGNLYVASRFGVAVFGPDGTARGTLSVPEQPANVGFGGPARHTLYVTARTGLYQVELPLPGF